LVRPKSEAGRRTVAIPAAIIADLEMHLAEYLESGPEGLVFVGPQGGPLRRGNFGRSIWRPAATATGVPHLHFHDLRHTVNTLAAATGASLRELMSRMGHSSATAALRYQHATADRDAVIAATLSELVDRSRDAATT
jgi:integrase